MIHALKIRVWWYRPVIPAFRRQKQEFKASLGNIARPCLK
jgi:hypothetical protein